MDYEDQFVFLCDQLWVKKEVRDKILIPFVQLERHHPYSAHHSLEVAKKAQEFASICCLNPSEAFIAGVSHDLGKGTVDREILDKKDLDLNSPEGEKMKLHALEGYRILMNLSLPFQALIALSHHWYQRRAYPDRIKIPRAYGPGSHLDLELYSPIIAISDNLDSLKRNNSWTKDLIGKTIKEAMTLNMPSQAHLIDSLANYDEGLSQRIAA